MNKATLFVKTRTMAKKKILAATLVGCVSKHEQGTLFVKTRTMAKKKILAATLVGCVSKHEQGNIVREDTNNGRSFILHFSKKIPAATLVGCVSKHEQTTLFVKTRTMAENDF
ncbi:MAG: hypothetical protein NZM39_08510 [Bernardetiaceae bacterium]|nr:hypothetical protein [Bernardetiaceae bacterium]